MAPPRLNYPCLIPCKRSFDSARGLTLHQGKCRIYNSITESEYEEAVEALEEVLSSKRQRVDESAIALDSELLSQLPDGLESSSSLPDCVPSINAQAACMPQPTNPFVFCETTSVPPQDSAPLQPDDIPEIQVMSPLIVNSEPILAPEELGRGRRKKWRPRKYMDPHPEPPAPLPDEDLQAPEPPGLRAGLRLSDRSDRWCRTAHNANGVFRQYITRPTFVPDEDPADTDIANQNEAHDGLSDDSLTSETTKWFAPLLNPACFRLLHWFWVGSEKKSVADLQVLADEVLKAPDFNTEDLQKFSAKSENKKLDAWAEILNSSSSSLKPNDGWHESSVSISLPTGQKYPSEKAAPQFIIHGLHYRSIVQVIKAAFQSKHSLRFHFTPFEQFWQPDKTKPAERVYDEVYSGNAWFKYHEEVQSLPRQPGDECERAIAGLMFWSDSTQLANFGTAFLWPLYMFFGNQSKYERSRPTSNACYHIAYLPKLPDSLADTLNGLTGGKSSEDVIAHCRKELLHALLIRIFDEDFTEAYKEGIQVTCADGKIRRLYPRILTYSGDYPEKCILSGIRQLAMCPCPRCLVLKSQTHRLGTKANEAITIEQRREDNDELRSQIKKSRQRIYEEGRSVTSTLVEDALSSKSLVPIKNAFSTFFTDIQNVLTSLTFNFFAIFVSDFLHEYELGIWKMTFIHLIRILTACGQQYVVALNERYRTIPTFSRNTIRKFSSDASSMKRMAARDYENLLLCSMPVFDGLLPDEHNAIVQDLLFALLAFHALAKLRMHTDSTLALLREAKQNLGVELRRFQETTCAAYETRELPGERAKRERREALRLAKENQKARLQRPLDILATTIPPAQGSVPAAPFRTSDVEAETVTGPLTNHLGDGVSANNLFDESILHLSQQPAMVEHGKQQDHSTVTVSQQTRQADEQPAVESQRTEDVSVTSTGCEPVQAQALQKAHQNKKKENLRKRYNLNTYKCHAPEHYIDDICNFGTLDSYSTQRGELEHRTVKKFYARTNKQNATKQMTKIERRRHLLRMISEDEPAKRTTEVTVPNMEQEEESPPNSRRDEHHFISKSRNDSIFLPSFLREHALDRAARNFRKNLKNHLLSRLIGTDSDWPEELEFTEADRNALQIEYDRIYKHNILRVNYTTYDGQRYQDSINPRTHPDIMVLARKDDYESIGEHHYWYARVIGIYHTSIRHTGLKSTTFGIPKKMEFLWVRWFGTTLDIPNGWSMNRLQAISFLPEFDSGAFGFLDPLQVVRGVHLMPAFRYGKTKLLLTGTSIARTPPHAEEDWMYYFINSFVDRDVFMRCAGGGVGHSLLKLNKSGSSALTKHWRSSEVADELDSCIPDDTVDRDSEADSDDGESAIDSDD